MITYIKTKKKSGKPKIHFKVQCSANLKFAVKWKGISTDIYFAVLPAPHSSKGEGDIGMGQNLEKSLTLSSEKSQSGTLRIKRKRLIRLVSTISNSKLLENYYLPNQ